MLYIKDLFVNIENINLINGLNLIVNPNEVHAIMGPNGSGKSTLSATLAGDRRCQIISGKILFKNRDLTILNPEERAGIGIFVAFQYPVEIPGICNKFFLYKSVNAIRKYNKKTNLDRFQVSDLIKKNAKIIDMSEELIERSLNFGFSGGEKKTNEILQMMLLKPYLCILDEIDSGLDIDALKKISDVINKLKNKQRSFIVITHYRHILNYINPDYVHIIKSGRIIKSGDFSLVKEIEEKGYDRII